MITYLYGAFDCMIYWRTRTWHDSNMQSLFLFFDASNSSLGIFYFQFLSVPDYGKKAEPTFDKVFI